MIAQRESYVEALFVLVIFGMVCVCPVCLKRHGRLCFAHLLVSV